MSQITGTPAGSVVSQEDRYLEGAPNVYFQDYRASELFNPDSAGFYYGLSGTPTYPVYALGCIENVALADKLTMNDVRCDNIGVVDTIQRRDYLVLTLTISTIFPLSTIRDILRGGAVTQANGTEKMGLGVIDQSRRSRVYMPTVYDQDNAYWLAFTLHKCKFVDAWSIGFRYGQQWQIANIKVHAYADATLPAAQQFATVYRRDPGILP